MRMDIDTYTKRAGRVDLDGIDFDDFRRQPLDDDTLRCLRYMHDVEHHTVCYLRDLLVTSAHRDPERVAELSVSTIWFFVPSVPLFIALPLLIRSGLGFWSSIALCVLGTLALYALWFWAAPKLGIKL